MLKNLIDPNETILWQGKPHHFLYTPLPGLSMLV